MVRQLGGRGRLAGTLEAQKQNDGHDIGAAQLLILPGVPQQRDDLIVYDLYELLPRRYGAKDLLALGFLNRRVYKAANDPKVYIRFQQGELDLLNRVFNIFFADGRFSADGADGVSKLLG